MKTNAEMLEELISATLYLGPGDSVCGEENFTGQDEDFSKDLLDYARALLVKQREEQERKQAQWNAERAKAKIQEDLENKEFFDQLGKALNPETK